MPELSASELKLVYLLIFSFMALCLMSFLIVMRSIGDIDNIITYLSSILRREAILRYNKQISVVKKNKKKHEILKERIRRKEAILNIPLMHKKK